LIESLLFNKSLTGLWTEILVYLNRQSEVFKGREVRTTLAARCRLPEIILAKTIYC